jgi:hypothetical protein
VHRCTTTTRRCRSVAIINGVPGEAGGGSPAWGRAWPLRNRPTRKSPTPQRTQTPPRRAEGARPTGRNASQGQPHRQEPRNNRTTQQHSRERCLRDEGGESLKAWSRRPEARTPKVRPRAGSGGGPLLLPVWSRAHPPAEPAIVTIIRTSVYVYDQPRAPSLAQAGDGPPPALSLSTQDGARNGLPRAIRALRSMDTEALFAVNAFRRFAFRRLWRVGTSRNISLPRTCARNPHVTEQRPSENAQVN